MWAGNKPLCIKPLRFFRAICYHRLSLAYSNIEISTGNGMGAILIKSKIYELAKSQAEQEIGNWFHRLERLNIW